MTNELNSDNQAQCTDCAMNEIDYQCPNCGQPLIPGQLTYQSSQGPCDSMQCVAAMDYPKG